MLWGREWDKRLASRLRGSVPPPPAPGTVTEEDAGPAWPHPLIVKGLKTWEFYKNLPKLHELAIN